MKREEASKWLNEIIAFAHGATVQYKFEGVWVEPEKGCGLGFYEGYEYRIKETETPPWQDPVSEEGYKNVPAGTIIEIGDCTKDEPPPKPYEFRYDCDANQIIWLTGPTEGIMLAGCVVSPTKKVDLLGWTVYGYRVIGFRSLEPCGIEPQKLKEPTYRAYKWEEIDETVIGKYIVSKDKTMKVKISSAERREEYDGILITLSDGERLSPEQLLASWVSCRELPLGVLEE